MQFHFRCKRIAFDTLDICFPIRREVILSNCKAVANSSLSASDNGVSNLPMPIFVIKSTHLYNNTKKIECLSFHNAEKVSPEATRQYVEQYLAHFLPEDEFDRLFKGRKK